MSLSRISPLAKQTLLLQKIINNNGINLKRTMATIQKQRIILSEPEKTQFGLLKIILTVVPGLFIGAAISKNIANFLEENDLFVPSDDDDDDD